MLAEQNSHGQVIEFVRGSGTIRYCVDGSTDTLFAYISSHEMNSLLSRGIVTWWGAVYPRYVEETVVERFVVCPNEKTIAVEWEIKFESVPYLRVRIKSKSIQEACLPYTDDQLSEASFCAVC